MQSASDREAGNPEALTAMNFFYRNSKQLHEPDNNLVRRHLIRLCRTVRTEYFFIPPYRLEAFRIESATESVADQECAMPVRQLLILIVLSLSFFIGQAGAYGTAAGTSKGPSQSGTVLETMESGGYTYIKLDQDGKMVWIAVRRANVAVGDEVEYSEQMRMPNFTSKTLNKSFDEIVFASLRGKHAMASPMQPVREIAVGDEPIEKAEGGYTVAEVFANKETLKGKLIKVRGRVVKVSQAIMYRNWIHLKDGTGEKGNDKIVFRSEDQVARVGSIVTAEGRLETDKDFGYGYRYEVLVEDASFSD